MRTSCSGTCAAIEQRPRFGNFITRSSDDAVSGKDKRRALDDEVGALVMWRPPDRFIGKPEWACAIRAGDKERGRSGIQGDSDRRHGLEIAAPISRFYAHSPHLICDPIGGAFACDRAWAAALEDIV